MTTPASREPASEWLRQWWWFDPLNAGEKSHSALTWELLRRTKFFSALWREHEAAIAQLSQPKRRATSPADDPMLRYLSGTLPSVLGPDFAHLFLNGCHHSKTWLELSPSQRAVIKGKPALLPRQGRPDSETQVTLGIIEVIRDGRGFLQGGKRGNPAALRSTGVHEAPEFQKLPVDASCAFIFVRFDPALRTESLERAFDTALINYLTPRPSITPQAFAAIKSGQPWSSADYVANSSHATAFIEKVTAERWDDDKKWTEISADRSLYPELWKFDDTIGPRKKVEPSIIIPDQHEPFAVCFIPTLCDIRTTRARFRNLVRQENRRRWLPACLRVWRGRKVVFSAVPPMKRSHQKYPRFGPWFGLVANDCRLKIDARETNWICQQWHTHQASLGKTKRSKDKSGALSNLHNQKRAIEKRIASLDSSPRSTWSVTLASLRARPEFPYC